MKNWNEFLKEVKTIDNDLSATERKYPIYVECDDGLRKIEHIDWEATDDGNVRFKIVLKD